MVVTAEKAGELKTALEPVFGEWAMPAAAVFLILAVGSTLALSYRVARRRQAEAA